MRLREIELTQGKKAIVDESIYEDLAQYNWVYANGYAVRGSYNKDTKKTTTIMMHRQILNPSKHLQVDHINGNKLDNRTQNLRQADSKQNQYNRGIQKNNTSGYKGVYWHKGRNKWMTLISYNGKLNHVGYFRDIINAAKAYDAQAIEHHGKYAKLNLVH